MSTFKDEVRGLTYFQAVAMLNLFFFPLIAERSQSNIRAEMRRRNISMGEALFWTDFFPHRRSVTLIPHPQKSYAVTFQVQNKGQGCWYIQPQNGVNRVTVSDAPERGKQSATIFTATNRGDRGWTLAIEARPGCNPTYKAAFDKLRNQRAAA